MGWHDTDYGSLPFEDGYCQMCNDLTEYADMVDDLCEDCHLERQEDD